MWDGPTATHESGGSRHGRSWQRNASSATPANPPSARRPGTLPVMVAAGAVWPRKYADTLRAAVMESVHGPLPVHDPDHPRKSTPGSGELVNVTVVPSKYDSEQSPGQVIPVGEAVTPPGPLTATVKGKIFPQVAF